MEPLENAFRSTGVLSNRRSMTGPSRPIEIFTPSFADEGGTNAQNLTVKEVVARLDSQRFHVTMFYLHKPDPRISARPNTRLWKWRSHGNTMLTLVRLGAKVPDVYFFPREGPLDERVLAWRSRLGWRTAVVTYIVSGGLDTLGPRSGQLRNLRYASAVVGNCRHITDLLCGLGFEAETIHDGVDRRYYFPREVARSEDEGHLTVLFAGSFRPYKRADLVVREAARWPSAQFRLAGTGEEDGACRKLAAELGCRNVKFLGHLGQAELGREMREADIFLFPSELEGHPQVLLQAAGCGLPCVAMSSYHPDAIVDGETGFLADSADDLSLKFGRLVQDGALRAAMSAAAAAHSMQFDWDQTAAQWAQIFERFAERRT